MGKMKLNKEEVGVVCGKIKEVVYNERRKSVKVEEVEKVVVEMNELLDKWLELKKSVVGEGCFSFGIGKLKVENVVEVIVSKGRGFVLDNEIKKELILENIEGGGIGELIERVSKKFV